MLEALTMLTTVEDGKRFKIKLEQFRQNLFGHKKSRPIGRLEVFKQQFSSLPVYSYRYLHTKDDYHQI